VRSLNVFRECGRGGFQFRAAAPSVPDWLSTVTNIYVHSQTCQRNNYVHLTRSVDFNVIAVSTIAPALPVRQCSNGRQSPKLDVPCLGGFQALANSLRIGVLSQNQNLDERPREYVTRSRAQVLLRKNAAESAGANKIRMRPVKAFLLNQNRLVVSIVPQLLPPRPPFGLLIRYPLPDQRSSHVRNV
jgi:hypothetical protein